MKENNFGSSKLNQRSSRLTCALFYLYSLGERGEIEEKLTEVKSIFTMTSF